MYRNVIVDFMKFRFNIIFLILLAACNPKPGDKEIDKKQTGSSTTKNKTQQQEPTNIQKLDTAIKMADMYYSRSEYQLAMKYTIKSIEYATELKNKSKMAEAYRILGCIYMDIGEYEASSVNIYKSLKLFEEISDTIGTAQALSNIGTLFFINENYEKSLEYVNKSIVLSKMANDTIGVSCNLNNLATCYASMGMFENVEKYIHEAIALNKKTGLKVPEGINYQNMGEVFNDKKMYDSALLYFEKANFLFNETKSYTMLPALYINFSQYYKNVEKKSLELEYAQKAYSIAQLYNLKKDKIASTEKLHQIYLSQNDIANAYHFISILYQLKDSLRLDESMVKLSQLEFQYNMEKKEQEKKIAQQNRDFIILLFIISLIVVILIVLFLFTRQKMIAKNSRLEQQRLQAEVEFKNKELTSNVIGVIKKNEILAEISEKLLLIEHKTAQKEIKDDIFKLSGEIEQTMNTKIWDEFEKRFTSVHNDFYSKLMDKYPDLTPNELKLCAFLRLNITTKDISELTGQQVSAIEVARYRLRKKLKLSNTQVNLVAFLSQI